MVLLKMLTVDQQVATHNTNIVRLKIVLLTISIRQAARAAFVTSSFKIFLTQTFPRCGATCYILPSRAMTQLFNGVNFVYRSVEVYLHFAVICKF